MPDNQKSSTNHLLSIGIDDYHHLPKLFNAVKDAREVVEILEEKYFFKKENMHSIYNRIATKDSIIKGFKNLVEKVKPEDNVIIYFSGHGEFDKTFNEGYWMPVDAENNNYTNAIPNSFIKKMLGAIKCLHLFVIVDSCFSGTLFNRGKGRVANRLEQEPSRWGLTSGRAEIVADGKAGDNSPFAESILYILKNNKKALGVAELCRRVVEVTASNATQTPLGEPLDLEGHEGGQFVFHPEADEATEWAQADSKNNLNQFENYLNKYPQGKYVALAKSRIQRLEADQKWEAIKGMAENNVTEISEKIRTIDVFIQNFSQTPAVKEALYLGENLEYKGSFFEAQKSIFTLRTFARKTTPFQKEAQRLLLKFEKDEYLKSTPNVPISNSNIVQNQPTYEHKRVSKKTPTFIAKLAIGLSVVALLLVGVYFLLPSKSFTVIFNGNPKAGIFELVFEEGSPPYKIQVLKNGEELSSTIKMTKGSFPVSNFLRETGVYVFVIEDSKERTCRTAPITIQ